VKLVSPVNGAIRIFEMDFTCQRCGEKFPDNIGALELWCPECLIREPENDEEFLKQLFYSMHDRKADYNAHKYGEPKFYFIQRRQINDNEWAKVKKIAKNFIIEPINAGMGFNFGLLFWKHPTFPGVPPEIVYSIEGEAFGMKFKEAFKKLSPLSHNKKNAELLKQYQFEPPKGDDHYDY